MDLLKKISRFKKQNRLKEAAHDIYLHSKIVTFHKWILYKYKTMTLYSNGSSKACDINDMLKLGYHW
jgi:hypothetical protein